MAQRILVLWDIDRTLLYVGDIDRQVYRETFAEIVGRPADRLPARGTGVTMPLAIQSLLLENGVPELEVPRLLPRMVDLLPHRLAAHAQDLRRLGVLLPGAASALKAVHGQAGLLPTVVTGNLKPNALLKLRAFQLEGFLDTEIGGTHQMTITAPLSSRWLRLALRADTARPSRAQIPSSSETRLRTSVLDSKAELV